MRSVKKMALLVAALAAVMVVSSSAVAGAAGLYPKPEPKALVPVGTPITATSTNWTIKTSYGNFSCKSMTLQGKVTKNSGGLVELVGGAGATSECFFNGVTPIGVKAQMTKLNLSGSGPGVMGVKYTLETPELTCNLETSTASVNYSPGASAFRAAGTLKSDPEACGPLSFTADFALASNGSPLFIY